MVASSSLPGGSGRSYSPTWSSSHLSHLTNAPWGASAARRTRVGSTPSTDVISSKGRSSPMMVRLECILIIRVDSFHCEAGCDPGRFVLGSQPQLPSFCVDVQVPSCNRLAVELPLESFSVIVPQILCDLVGSRARDFGRISRHYRADKARTRRCCLLLRCLGGRRRHGRTRRVGSVPGGDITGRARGAERRNRPHVPPRSTLRGAARGRAGWRRHDGGWVPRRSHPVPAGRGRRRQRPHPTPS